MELISVLVTAGVRTITFAGGDPSLRRDLPDLVGLAKGHGLRVEIQTNAQVVPPGMRKALSMADRVCLSLDGPDPETHDRIRLKPGNFTRVLALARRLAEVDVPVSVRSVVTQENMATIGGLLSVVASLPTCEIWSLLEFSPVGDGHRNRARYEIDADEFEVVAGHLAAVASEIGVTTDVLRHRDKVGLYVQVTPDGRLYGTTHDALFMTGEQELVGDLLVDHIDKLAARLPFNAANHHRRYGWETAGR